MRRSTGERRRSSRIPPTRRNPSYAPSRPTHRGSAAENMDLILAEARRSARGGRSSRKTQLRQQSVQRSRHHLANAVPSSASPRNFRLHRELYPLTASASGDRCHLAQQQCRKSRRRDWVTITAVYHALTSRSTYGQCLIRPKEWRLAFDNLRADQRHLSIELDVFALSLGDVVLE